MEEYCSSSKKDLLTTSLAGKYLSKETTDIATVESSCVQCHNIVGGIHMEIELKKQLNERHIRQAVMELLTANCLSNYPVVITPTDLRREWVFYWISTGGIQQYSRSLQNAILTGAGKGSCLNV